jgi:hypothetical protein
MTSVKLLEETSRFVTLICFFNLISYRYFNRSTRCLELYWCNEQMNFHKFGHCLYGSFYYKCAEHGTQLGFITK